jgi:hypothetical protein
MNRVLAAERKKQLYEKLRQKIAGIPPEELARIERGLVKSRAKAATDVTIDVHHDVLQDVS